MCLRVYLNGDDSARGTHISLFFVLMPGEYDRILKFPFNFKVLFCLYDQTDKQNHIIRAFHPNIKSSSFEQPHSNMNTASGILEFAPLPIFLKENNPYVRDDTMFIKVMIDFGFTSETMLSYALSFNPAVTTQDQHKISQWKS